MADRRARIRFEQRYPAKVVTSQTTMEGETKNIGRDGAFITCEKPLAPKESFTLTIEFPDGFIMDTPAEVVWSNIPGPDDEVTEHGMGVRFLW